MSMFQMMTSCDKQESRQGNTVLSSLREEPWRKEEPGDKQEEQPEEKKEEQTALNSLDATLTTAADSPSKRQRTAWH